MVPKSKIKKMTPIYIRAEESIQKTGKVINPVLSKLTNNNNINNGAQSQKLTHLRDTLLLKLMSGAIRMEMKQ